MAPSRPRLSVLVTLLPGLLLLSACSSVPVAARAERAPAGAPVRNVEMTAEKYSFDPEEIHVEQGEIVVLTITSKDVKHGFKISQIDLDVLLPPNQPVEVRLWAEKKGVIPFRCSKFCGWGHFGMNGEIIVK